MGAVARAEGAFQEAYRIQPQNRDVLIGLAWCSYKQGHLNGALAYLDHALELNEHDTLVWQQIGWCNYFHGQFREAVDTFRQILRIDAGDISAASFLGLSLVQLGELVEARTVLNGVIARDAANVEARIGITMLEARMGNSPNAVEALNAATRAQSSRERQYSLALMFPGKNAPETYPQQG